MRRAAAPARGFGHADSLRFKIRLAEPWLARATQAFWSHRRLLEMFPEYLLALQGSVRATVPLMEAAARRARERSDPVSARLVAYYERHAREEQDHEEWLLADMEAIGLRRPDVLNHVPSPTVAALVGAQYYWLQHVHPVSLLGYFSVLEGFPPSAEHLADVRARTGLPPEAFRMLLHHAEDDRRHGAEVFALLDDLPLSEELSRLVGLSALHTVATLSALFREILDAHADGRRA